MATKLGAAISQGSTPAASSSVASRFLAALAGRRVLKPVTIPALGLDAVMTLLGSQRLLDIDGEVERAMEKRGLEHSVLTMGKFELETAVRVLAEAVMDATDTTQALGTVAEWGLLTPEVIGDLWRQYGDLREEHDPSIEQLTPDELLELRTAVSKKNGTLLRVYGARRLSAFLLTLDDPLASSETSRSSPGDSSPTS